MTKPVQSVTSKLAARGVSNAPAARRLIPVVTLLGVVLVLAFAASLAVGAVHLPLPGMLLSLLHGRALTSEQSVILIQLRLPRACAGALVGAALSVAGLLFQGLFRNPLADPYVIGSSGGALLGASIGMFLLPQVSVLGFTATAVLAFAGSLLTIMLVYALARTADRTPIVTLLLAGFAVSSMLSYSSYCLELLSQNYGSGVTAISSWLRGVISVPGWMQLGITGLMIGCGMLLSIPFARRLNTLALGEEYAEQVGLHVETVRLGIILVGSMLAAAAVALGGLIGFVGLLVPHIARMWMGPDHLRLLPVTALAGAIFLVLTDTLARTLLAPSELPVGVLMALLGGPFFLYLLRRQKREYAL